MKNLTTYDEFLNEQVTIKNPKYYIATRKFGGDLGTIKKGEIFASTGKAKNVTVQGDSGKFKTKLIYVELADPMYDYYEEISQDEFNSIFRELESGTDGPSLKKLSKWGLVEFGTDFYVGSYFLSRNESPEDGAKKALNATLVTSETPRMAVKKKEGHVGKQTEILRNQVWVVKKWADMFEIVFAEGAKEKLNPKKLVKLLNKAGII